MKEKVLSVFIDESGDFGQYNPASPNYYVAMVYIIRKWIFRRILKLWKDR